VTDPGLPILPKDPAPSVAALNSYITHNLHQLNNIYHFEFNQYKQQKLQQAGSFANWQQRAKIDQMHGLQWLKDHNYRSPSFDTVDTINELRRRYVEGGVRKRSYPNLGALIINYIANQNANIADPMYLSVTSDKPSSLLHNNPRIPLDVLAVHCPTHNRQTRHIVVATPQEYVTALKAGILTAAPRGHLQASTPITSIKQVKPLEWLGSGHHATRLVYNTKVISTSHNWAVQAYLQTPNHGPVPDLPALCLQCQPINHMFSHRINDILLVESYRERIHDILLLP
jgi:hypothetical protein